MLRIKFCWLCKYGPRAPVSMLTYIKQKLNLFESLDRHKKKFFVMDASSRLSKNGICHLKKGLNTFHFNSSSTRSNFEFLKKYFQEQKKEFLFVPSNRGDGESSYITLTACGHIRPRPENTILRGSLTADLLFILFGFSLSFTCLVKSKSVKQEFSHKVILRPNASVLCIDSQEGTAICRENVGVVTMLSWRWSSGQCARLLLRQSELESSWSVQFISFNCCWKLRK